MGADWASLVQYASTLTGSVLTRSWLRKGFHILSLLKRTACTGRLYGDTGISTSREIARKLSQSNDKLAWRCTRRSIRSLWPVRLRNGSRKRSVTARRHLSERIGL